MSRRQGAHEYANPIGPTTFEGSEAEETRVVQAPASWDREDPESPRPEHGEVEGAHLPAPATNAESRTDRAACSYACFWLACIFLLAMSTPVAMVLSYTAVLVQNSLTILVACLMVCVPMVLWIGLRAARHRHEATLRLFAFLTLLLVAMQCSMAVVIMLDSGVLSNAWVDATIPPMKELCTAELDQLQLGTAMYTVCTCYVAADGSSADGEETFSCIKSILNDYGVTEMHTIEFLLGIVALEILLGKLAWGMMEDMDAKAQRKLSKQKGGAPIGTLYGEIVSGQELRNETSGKWRKRTSKRECRLVISNPNVHNKHHRVQEVVTAGIEDDDNPEWRKQFGGITLYASTTQFDVRVLDTSGRKAEMLGEAKVDLLIDESGHTVLPEYDYKLANQIPEDTPSDSSVCIDLQRTDPKNKSHGNVKNAGKVYLRLYRIPALSMGRAHAYGMTSSWYFESTVLGMCFISLAVLAMQSPANPPSVMMGGVVRILEIFCATFLSCEITLEILVATSARKAWWKDFWIGLSFLVLVCSWLTILSPPEVTALKNQSIAKSISFCRVFRILRPIRTLRLIRDIDIIVTVIRKSATTFFTVVSLLGFLLAVFALIGVSSFSGALQYECIGDGTRTVQCTLEQQYAAGNATGGPFPCPMPCPMALTCAADFSASNNHFCAPLVEKREVGSDSFGLRDFDSIGKGFTSMFVQTTGDGGMHTVSSALHNAGAASVNTSWAFFFVASVLLNLLALNLFLAICCSSYSEVYFSVERRRTGREKHAEDATGGIHDPENDGGRVARELQQEQQLRTSMEAATTYEDLVYQKRWNKATDRAAGCRNLCRAVSIHDYFEHTTSALIVANTVAMAMVYEGMPDAERQLLGKIELVFLMCFIIEAAIKWAGAGSHLYSSSKANLFDLCVICASVLGVAATYMQDILALTGADGKVLGSIQGLRAVRLLRALQVARLLHRSKALIVVLRTIFKAWRPILAHSIFCMFSVAMFAVIGMHLFGGSLGSPCSGLDSPGPENICVSLHDYELDLPEHLETFGSGVLTIFELSVGEDWSHTMYWYIKHVKEGLGYPDGAVEFYFISTHVWMNGILFSIYVAMLLQNFNIAEAEKMPLQKRSYDRKARKARRKMRKLKQSALINAIRDEQQRGAEIISDSIHSEFLKVAAQDHDLTHHSKKSLFCFRLDNRFRLNCARVQESTLFARMVLIIIIVSCASLALEGPQGSQEGLLADIFAVVNVLVLFIFIVRGHPTPQFRQRFPHFPRMHAHRYANVSNFSFRAQLEAAIKVVIHGFLFESGPTPPYLRSNMNRMDLLVITLCVMLYIPDMPSLAGPWARVLRMGRVVTPLLNLIKDPEVKLVLLSFLRAIPDSAVVMLPLMLMMVVFSIVGVEWFGGELSGCTNTSDPFVEVDEDLSNRTLCELTSGLTWQSPAFSFDDSLTGIALMFVSITDGAHEFMMEMRGAGVFKATAFWVSFQLVFRCFFLNLFLGVLSASYEKSCGLAATTVGEKKWRSTIGFVERFHPTATDMETLRPHEHETCCRRWSQPGWWFKARSRCFELATSDQMERVWRYGIIANTCTLATDRFPISETHHAVVSVLNQTFLGLCTLEVLIKLTGYGPRHYFSDGWMVSDFVLCVVSLGLRFGGAQSGVEVLRLVRVFRMIVLASKLPSLAKLIDTLMKCLRKSVAIMGITSLIVYIYAVLGMQLFGTLPTDEFLIAKGFATTANVVELRQGDAGALLDRVCPHCESIGSFSNFSNFIYSTRLLMQIAFQQEISGFVSEMMYLGSDFWLPFMYFCSYYIIAVWVCLNLLIVTVVSNFDAEQISVDGPTSLTNSDLDGFAHCWSALTIGTHSVEAADERRTAATFQDAMMAAVSTVHGGSGTGPTQDKKQSNAKEGIHLLEEGHPDDRGELLVKIETLEGVPCDTVSPYCVLTAFESVENSKTRRFSRHAKTINGTTNWGDRGQDAGRKDDTDMHYLEHYTELLDVSINSRHSHIKLDVYDSYKFSNIHLGAVRIPMEDLQTCTSATRRVCELQVRSPVDLGDRPPCKRGKRFWGRFDTVKDEFDLHHAENNDDGRPLMQAAEQRHATADETVESIRQQQEFATAARLRSRQVRLAKKQQKKRLKKLKKTLGSKKAEQDVALQTSTISTVSSIGARDESRPSGMTLSITITFKPSFQMLPALSFMEDYNMSFPTKECTCGIEGWLEVAKEGAWNGFERRYCFLQEHPFPCLKYYEKATSPKELETLALARKLSTHTIDARSIMSLQSKHDLKTSASKRKGVNFQLNWNEPTGSGKLVDTTLGQLSGSIHAASNLPIPPTNAQTAARCQMTEINFGDRPKGGAAERNEDAGAASTTEVKGAVVEDDAGMVPVADGGELYMAARRTKLRTSASTSSDVIGQLQRFEIVKVTHTKLVQSGDHAEVLRLKTIKGWVNATSSNGLSTVMIAKANPHKHFRCRHRVRIDADRAVNSKMVGHFEQNDVIESLEDVEDLDTGAVRHRTTIGWVCEFDFDAKATPDPYCVIEMIGAGHAKTASVNRSLSPHWDTAFQLRTIASSIKLRVSVYDDNGRRRHTLMAVSEAEIGTGGIPGPKLTTLGNEVFELTRVPKEVTLQLFTPGTDDSKTATKEADTFATNTTAPSDTPAGTVTLTLAYTSLFGEELLRQTQAESGGDLRKAMLGPETKETALRFRAMSPAIQRAWLGSIRWLATGRNANTRPYRIPLPDLVASELSRASKDISLLDLPFSRVPMLLKGLYARECMGSYKPTVRRLAYWVLNLELHASSAATHTDRQSRRIAHRIRHPDPHGIYMQEIRGLNFHKALERLCLLHYGKRECLSYDQQMSEYEIELRSVSLQIMIAVVSFWVFRVRHGKTVGGARFPHHQAWAARPRIYKIALEGVCVCRLRSLSLLRSEVERHSKPELADVVLPGRQNKGNVSPRRKGGSRSGGSCFKRSNAGGASSPRTGSSADLDPQKLGQGTTQLNAEERRARFEEAFVSMDESGGGTLDEAEVKNALEVLTKQPQSDDDVRSFMQMVDRDGSGEIELDEFVAGMEAVVEDAAMHDDELEHEDDDDSDLDELDKGIEDLAKELGPSVTN